MPKLARSSTILKVYCARSNLLLASTVVHYESLLLLLLKKLVLATVLAVRILVMVPFALARCRRDYAARTTSLSASLTSIRKVRALNSRPERISSSC